MNSTVSELKMAIPYLEHFLDTLETLPADLQRNFKLMQDLDSKTQELVSKINSNSDNYISNVNIFSAKDKTERFKEIHDSYEKAKVISDDKVQLAMQTYEMVDKHIRRLDSELSKLESELKEKKEHHPSCGSKGKGSSVCDQDNGQGKKRSMGQGGREKKRSMGQGGREKKKGFNPKNVIKGSKSEKVEKKVADTVPSLLSLRTDLPPLAALQAAVTNEVLDMPVDPNEPTYCTCHQVSYGEMIGCDNPDCPIEWFHFGCVGLTSKPKGKWYCSKCTFDRKKK